MSGITESISKTECQRLLMDFRVNDLRDLLRKVGQSQRGNKPALFQRANDILHLGTSKIQLHIQTIHKERRDTKKSPNPKTKWKKRQLNNSLTGPPDPVVHPDVKFKDHPFYKVLDVIIKPAALSPSHGVSRGNGNYNYSVSFHLQPSQVEQIYKSNNSKGEYRKQIILRFARRESSCEQEDFYPKECYIKVNGKFITIPGYVPQFSLKADYKRTGKPVNITNYINTSPSHYNEVVIYWSHDIVYPQGFCFTVQYVDNLSTSELLSKLRAKVRSPEISRSLVREKLSIDRDSEILATSLRISLICPLGMMRVTNPCRAKDCTHLQCFDASLYLQMNEKKAQWICPVCDKPAPYSDLFIDGFLKDISEKSTSDDIEFSADGGWKPFSRQATTLTLDTPVKPITILPEDTGSGSRNNPILISMSSDEEDILPVIKPSKRKESSSSSSGSETSGVSSIQTPQWQVSGLPPEASITRPSVIIQGPPPSDVITNPHGFVSSSPQEYTCSYQDSYHNDIDLDGSLLSLLNDYSDTQGSTVYEDHTSYS